MNHFKSFFRTSLIGFSAIICFISTNHITVEAQPTIQLIESKHIFGEINEIDGPVQHEFKIKNIGSEALQINEVKASCGCTTPDWTKTPIAPGETAFILAEYNPANRPGKFNKSLTVKSNASNGTQYLYIEGNVIQKPWEIKDDFPMELGGLRFESLGFNIGSITNHKSFTKVFKVYNQSEHAIGFNDQQKLPSFISVNFNPKKIEPSKQGVIMITYDAVKRNDLGYVFDPLELETDDKVQPKKKLSILASIAPYFPEMTKEELALAPKPFIKEASIDKGVLETTERYNYEFEVQNIGKKPLEILKINATCNCITNKTTIKEIGVGATQSLVFEFDPKDKFGRQVKTVDVFFNSPSQSKVTLYLKGRIK